MNINTRRAVNGGMDTSQYLETFVKETREHLQNFHECIVALEKEPGNKSTISELFRTTHSLKGMAGTMGFLRMQHLAGSIEDVCQEVRAGSMKVTGRMIDALFEGLDALEEYSENIKRTSKEGTEENEALIKKLRALFAEQADRKNTEKMTAALPVKVKLKEVKSGAFLKQKKAASAKNSVTASTVSVDIEKLDELMNQVSELILIKNKFVSMYIEERKEPENQSLRDGIEYLENITANLHESIMQVRMVPIESVVNKFPCMMRNLARKLGKRIELYTSGGDTKIDRTIADQIRAPLWHLLSNAAKHGIEKKEIRWQRGKQEKGIICLNIYQEDGNVIIHVRDDGNGIDVCNVKKNAAARSMITPAQADNMSEEETMQILFEKGFSMAEKGGDASGNGFGLYAARSAVEALGGDMEVSGMPLKGSVFTIRLPIALTIMRAVLVGIRQEKYAIAISSILTIEDMEEDDIHFTETGEMIYLRGMEIPLLHMDKILDLPPLQKEKKRQKVVVVKKGDKYAGLIVDDLIRQQEIVIKPLGRFIKADKIISGAAVLGDGKAALILDINALI